MKLEIKLIFLGFSILFLGSCNKNTSQKDKTNGKFNFNNYYDLSIINTVINYPYYKCNKCATPTDSFALKEILKVRKEINNKKYGLIFRLHELNFDGGQSFPRTLISVSDNENFIYAFPFYDEYFYWRVYSYDREKCKELKHELLENTSFEQSLNYLAEKVDHIGIESKENLDEIITILADSLLEMKELQVKDTALLNKLKTNIRMDIALNQRIDCLENLNNNLDYIKKNLSQNKNRYFLCKEGNYAFWEFKINELKNGKLKIVPNFLNKECYFSIYY